MSTEQNIERITVFVKRITGHNVSVFAAQATLFMIISSVPFLMFLLSVAQFVVPFSETDIIDAINSVMPYVTHRTVELVVQEIFNHQAVSIISVTAVTLVWSASRGMAALMQGLERVNEIYRKRNWLAKRIIALLYTLAFVAALVITLVLLVMGNSITRIMENHLPYASELAGKLAFMKYLIPGVMLTAIFWAGYKFLPGRRENKCRNLPGAVFSTVGWIAFSYMFGIYTTYFSNYSYVYGSLTFIALLMLWMYVCMNIFLIGAELNCMLYEYERQKKISGGENQAARNRK